MNTIESLREMLNTEVVSNYEPRLIPVVSDRSLELRIVSVLLATMKAVKPFAKDVLDRFGLRVGKTSKLTCLAELPLKHPKDVKSIVRPDGILHLKSGTKEWTAILEAKVKNNVIEESQLQAYSDVAKGFGIDAVITLTNQLAFLPTHTPYKIPKFAGKSVAFYHVSWISLVRQAQLLLGDKENRELNPEQAFVLNEMIRYLEHASSGVKRFEQMNDEWPALIDAVRDNRSFPVTAPEIANTVTSWHQEERDVCLLLGKLIAKQVGIHTTKRLRDSAEMRFADACQALNSSRLLQSRFTIPDAASELEVNVDLTRKTITCSMELEGPKDFKLATASINWLVRQLKGVDGSDVTIRANWPRRAASTQALLDEVRNDPRCLVSGELSVLPRSFEILIINEPTKQRFKGRKNFILDLERFVPAFYDRVGQRLRRWTPKPPKIESKVDIDVGAGQETESYAAPTYDGTRVETASEC
ncbi:MAG: hypothetical protein OXG08_02650 [Gammaproteobacteria bacterium]|nr:hypothetical protein [Gammaproteobacteria bacterium]